ncbi:MAG TPA: hypothetical protein VFQ32_08790, partial [Ktedonobacterales bacterium]|nr:hypothetical protein [Ktedonobacterales bacterium]
ALVWLFTVEGLADFINATAQGMRLDIVTHNLLGVAWLLPTYGVPAFAVAQVMVIAVLLNRARRERAANAADDTARAAEVSVPLTVAAS